MAIPVKNCVLNGTISDHFWLAREQSIVCCSPSSKRIDAKPRPMHPPHPGRRPARSFIVFERPCTPHGHRWNRHNGAFRAYLFSRRPFLIFEFRCERLQAHRTRPAFFYKNRNLILILILDSEKQMSTPTLTAFQKRRALAAEYAIFIWALVPGCLP